MMAKLNLNKNKLLWLGFLLILAGAAYWGKGFFSGGSAAQANAKPPTEVEVMTLKEQPVALSKELSGRTNAYKVAEIRPQVSGIITERLFKEGGMVEKGQQLYQIDPASYNAVYVSAMADLKQAQAKSTRFAELIKIDAVSQQEYDDVVAALAQAEAAVAVAKVNLNYTNVYAPIAGHIGKSTLTAGALVTANQVAPIATITQLDPIYVDLILPGQELMSLRQQINDDKKIAVTLIDEDGQPLSLSEGALQFSEVTVDESTGTVLLRALFPNPDSYLLPGMFVRAKLNLHPRQAILVPQAATVRMPDGTLNVWVVAADGTVQPKPIKSKEAIGNNWLVESGVEDGAVIVTQGFQKIAPGMLVKTVMRPAEGE